MYNKSIKNYAEAKQFLGNKRERPYAHNTRIMWEDSYGAPDYDSIKATYHGHIVARFYVGYTVYSSCGWMTPTTKLRLNWFLPKRFSLWQEKGIWYLNKRRLWDDPETFDTGHWIFKDGLVIDNHDRVSNAGDVKEAEEKIKLSKRINQYADGYVKAFLKGKVPEPSRGDCWGCCMKDVKTGQEVMGNDHLLSHIKEKYYVPSLLVNAIKQFPVCEMAMWVIGERWQEDSNEKTKFCNDVFAEQVKSSIVRYMKLRLEIAA